MGDFEEPGFEQKRVSLVFKTFKTPRVLRYETPSMKIAIFLSQRGSFGDRGFGSQNMQTARSIPKNGGSRGDGEEPGFQRTRLSYVLQTCTIRRNLRCKTTLAKIMVFLYTLFYFQKHKSTGSLSLKRANRSRHPSKIEGARRPILRHFLESGARVQQHRVIVYCILRYKRRTR